MPAKAPEEICGLFQRFMAEGDLEGMLSVYDPEAVFLKESRETTQDRDELRQVLAPLAEAKTKCEFEVKQIVQADGVALMHTRWKMSGAQPRTTHAIEVARRQADGTWRWLIGDPFTVKREVGG
jgi:uncharacterized protein (TIGR02246 family)